MAVMNMAIIEDLLEEHRGMIIDIIESSMGKRKLWIIASDCNLEQTGT